MRGEWKCDRRRALSLSMAAMGTAAALGSVRAQGAAIIEPRIVPAQRRWSGIPKPVSVTEGLAPLPGVKLYYWDTGGSGEPILLCHPATGSAFIWGYQLPVFAKAGYRVIGYSRRGFARSEAGPSDDTGHAVDDIDALLDHLKVEQVHMVASAAGGFSVADFARSHPARLISMSISCSFGGVTEESFRARMAKASPPAFATLPSSFRELGAFYRDGYPQGVEEWVRLEELSRSGDKLVIQTPRNRMDFADLEKIRVPALIIAGASDLITPLSLMLELASHLPNSETVVISDCGHSAYWEQPNVFNDSVLSFIGRHRAR